MHLFFSYCKSHRYELHALLAATIAFWVMFPLKRPIKASIDRWFNKKALTNKKWEQHRQLYRKRYNMIVLLLTVVLSGILYGIVSFLSPFIDFSWGMTWMSGAFSLTEYAVYDQIFCREGKKL